MSGASWLADPAVQGFLAGRVVVVLATLDGEGAPSAVPVWFVHDQSALYVPTVAATAKVRHVARDPRVAVTAEAGQGDDLRGISFQGRAEAMPDTPERQRIAERLLAKYHPYLAARWRGTTLPPDRVLLKVVPTRAHAWGLGVR